MEIINIVCFCKAICQIFGHPLLFFHYTSGIIYIVIDTPTTGLIKTRFKRNKKYSLTLNYNIINVSNLKLCEFFIPN